MRFIYIIFSLFIILNLGGCASKKLQESSVEVTYTDEDEELLDEFEDELEVEEIYDPLNGYNRVMTSINDSIYVNVLNPVAKGYKSVVHVEIRQSVKNFFHNIGYPIRFINNVLQGKFKNGAEETGRFIINSTVGVLGLFDLAKSEFQLQPHNEDFGQTLGYYGVGSGFHIVLPLLGPSNLRDALSLYPDSLADPVDHYDSRGYNLASDYKYSLYIKTYKTINKASIEGEQYEKMKEDAVDLYPYLRDVYEQYRDKQIKGETPRNEDEL